jgi:hypothetical protein
MAVNPYFNKFKNLSEQNLVEDLTIEAIKIHGMEMYYIPRTMVHKDDFFGEAAYSRFNSFKMIEMYMDTTTAFEGGDQFTKFGFEVRDSVKFTVSRKRFKRETGMARPMEGDLLFLPLNKGLFEIKFVEHENPFYQLGKLHSYQMTCELFQYSEEKLNTGIPEIDAVEEVAFKLQLTLGATSGTGTFAKGDFVYQPSGGSITGNFSTATSKATVYSWNPQQPSSMVLVDSLGGWSLTGGYVTKSDNTAYYPIAASGSTEAFGTLVDNSNAAIQAEADGFLNFDENHPFGEP